MFGSRSQIRERTYAKLIAPDVPWWEKPCFSYGKKHSIATFNKTAGNFCIYCDKKTDAPKEVFTNKYAQEF